jgi:hypothetical protein
VDETVRQWAEVHTIYRADSDDQSLGAKRPTGPMPVAPVVITPPPLVALRPDEETAADAD